jgi:hypothetical protein
MESGDKKQMIYQVKVSTSSKPVLHFLLAVLSFAEKTLADNMELQDEEHGYSIAVEEIDDDQLKIFTGEESDSPDESPLT